MDVDFHARDLEVAGACKRRNAAFRAFQLGIDNRCREHHHNHDNSSDLDPEVCQNTHLRPFDDYGVEIQPRVV